MCHSLNDLFSATGHSNRQLTKFLKCRRPAINYSALIKHKSLDCEGRSNTFSQTGKPNLKSLPPLQPCLSNNEFVPFDVYFDAMDSHVRPDDDKKTQLLWWIKFLHKQGCTRVSEAHRCEWACFSLFAVTESEAQKTANLLSSEWLHYVDSNTLNGFKVFFPLACAHICAVGTRCLCVCRELQPSGVCELETSF